MSTRASSKSERDSGLASRGGPKASASSVPRKSVPANSYQLKTVPSMSASKPVKGRSEPAPKFQSSQSISFTHFSHTSPKSNQKGHSVSKETAVEEICKKRKCPFSQDNSSETEPDTSKSFSRESTTKQLPVKEKSRKIEISAQVSPSKRLSREKLSEKSSESSSNSTSSESGAQPATSSSGIPLGVLSVNNGRQLPARKQPVTLPTNRPVPPSRNFNRQSSVGNTQPPSHRSGPKRANSGQGQVQIGEEKLASLVLIMPQSFGIRRFDITDKDINSNKKDQISKTHWSYYYCGDVQYPEICYQSVESLCDKETLSCPKLHSDYHYHWQIRVTNSNGKWINLPMKQVDALEMAYCDPYESDLDLPVLDKSELPVPLQDLYEIMDGKRRWKADFYSMTLKYVMISKFDLRRLYTKTYPKKSDQPSASRFCWYFLDDDNKWIEYGKESNSHKSSVNSQYIESCYISSGCVLNFQTRAFQYIIDFVRMVQINQTTSTVRDVRRRPVSHLTKNVVSSSDLPLNWTPMGDNERFERVILDSGSHAFRTIAELIKNQLSVLATFEIIKLERVQNPYFYRAFQNKIEEMKLIYKNDREVDVKLLFHGTNPNTVSKICSENFDWRLHGNNCGQIYGRGVYFSPNFSLAYEYCRPDSTGHRYMFLARVAVGSYTVGNSSMVRPPINPQTQLPFHSTVDNIRNPNIVVKYDKQEYFPAYILTLK